MSEVSQGEVTRLLRKWSAGNQQALDDLLPLVYRELQLMAGRYLRKERSDHTMQSTDLVHEAYLRLMGQRRVKWQDRAHFFAIAAQAMRRILVDHARRNQAEKRIGAHRKVPLEWAPNVATRPDATVLEVDQALSRLGELDKRQAKVVELRYFGGLTVAETAEVLGVSDATVAREWRAARVWLRQEMKRGAGGGP
jgi:RNA polymerase sigma factor (TIGR02999 family)